MNMSWIKKEKINRKTWCTGLTLVEVLISLAIFTVIASLIALFAKDIFSINGYVSSDLNAQIAGRRTVVSMIKEMREMSPSSLGTFAINQAATSSVTFYSNIDTDSLKEQVKYYRQGNSLLKSVIKPSGTPLVYNAGSAVITTAIPSLTNSTSTPIFEYYDSNYSGTTTPLTYPVDLSRIKFIKVNIFLERKSSKSNLPLNITSGTSLRNLKDNI